MTEEQLQILAIDIAADPVFNSVPHDTTGGQVVADAYNLTATPDYWVWKTRLTREECTAQMSPDGTFWSWSAYIGRTIGERDAFREIFSISGEAGTVYVNPSLPNVRSGFADIFSGSTGATQRAHLLSIARRLASRAEKLFGSGAGTVASPSVMEFEGLLTSGDVIHAWTL